MHDQNISDEFLNSFIDNQLEPAEKLQAFNTIRQNETLKQRVCEMRDLKEIIRLAYKQPPPYERHTAAQYRPSVKYFQALAASIPLLLGGISGWISHEWSGRGNDLEMAAMQHTSQHADAVTATRKIIVHISQSNPMKFKAALDETESLLATYRRSNQPIQVEVIANKHGVDLLRSKVSAYEGRIDQMQGKYPNLNFLVCGKTIARLRNQGESVQLLPHTGIATSAADQINKRLHEGWGYVKI